MLRGLCGEEIVIHAADRDLHSGFYGSAAANPNHVLARILADLHDADGRVTLPGFYDGVPELPERAARQWEKLDFDREADFLGEIGLSVPAGEKGRSVLELTWSRPTAEVNGMGGGYQGDGLQDGDPGRRPRPRSRSGWCSTRTRTRSAPRSASSCRPRLPADCRVEFHEHGSGRAVALRTSRPGLRRRRRPALTDEWGKAAVFIGGGGSIPVNVEFKKTLGHGRGAGRLRARTTTASTARTRSTT